MTCELYSYSVPGHLFFLSLQTTRLLTLSFLLMNHTVGICIYKKPTVPSAELLNTAIYICLCAGSILKHGDKAIHL